MQDTVLTNSLRVGLQKGSNVRKSVEKKYMKVFRMHHRDGRENLLPRVVAHEKDVLLTVDEYKLPA